MRISVILSTDIKRSMYLVLVSHDFIKFHLLSPGFVFYSFGLKLSLMVILTNFSHSSNSLKSPAGENLQFYSMSLGNGFKYILTQNEV